MIALILALACSSGPAEPPPLAAPPEQPHPDLVLVTLDTTRADHLGCYGHAGARTDWIDALAARGVRFTQAHSPLPLTIPAHASIMTGLDPYRHGIRSNGDAVLDASFQTLAERLADRGYQAGAAVAAFVTTRAWGFAQGFRWYRDDIPEVAGNSWHAERPAEQVVDDAIGILDAAEDDAPLFLWVHLYDAHDPYAPPEPYRTEFAEHPYDGELAYIDDQLERLAGALAEHGRDPVWIVAGDHGEGHGEHAEYTHSLFIYEPTQHVPLIIAGPGIEPAVVDQPVGLTDVLPTAMHLLGFDAPGDLTGRVQPGNPHPVYMESYQLTERFGYAPQVGILDGALKLIRKPIPELYDVVADPAEKTNLAEAHPDDVARLSAEIDALGATPPGERTAALDPAALAQLEALGYVVGEPMDVDFAALPDPLPKKPVIARVQRADIEARAGRIDKAIALLGEVAKAEPDLVAPRIRLARLLARNGRVDEAERVLAEAARRNPDDARVRLSNAIIAGRKGDHARALAEARAALAADPDSVAAAEVIARSLANLRRPDELDAFGKDFLAAHPDAWPVAAVLGIVHFDLRDYKGAEPLLRQAMRAPKPMPGVAWRLGAMAAAVERWDDAEMWARRELESNPKNTDARRLLARVLAKKHDEAGALAELDRLLADRPDDVALLHDKAVSELDLGRHEAALATVDRALSLAPDDPYVTLLKANILKRMGRMDEATKLKDRAFQLREALIEKKKAARAAGLPPKPAPATKP